MDYLFAIDTYKGCRVRLADRETIIVDGVRGTPLAIRFQKRIQDWSVVLHVSVRPSLDAGDWQTFYSGELLTSEQKRLWQWLQAQAFNQVFWERDTFITGVVDLLRNASLIDPRD